MLDSYLIGIGATVTLSVLWLMVQTAWRATFADVHPATDALAGRSSCGDAGCGSDCAHRPVSCDSDSWQKARPGVLLRIAVAGHDEEHR